MSLDVVVDRILAIAQEFEADEVGIRLTCTPFLGQPPLFGEDLEPTVEQDGDVFAFSIEVL